MLRTKLIKTPKDMRRRNYLIACTPLSLDNKHRELELFIYEHKFDLVGTAEASWEELHDQNFKISGYSLFKKHTVDKGEKRMTPQFKKRNK